MKKLMMALAIVCTAVATQAATVKWDSAKLNTAGSIQGGFSSTAIKSAATAYLFTLTASDYAGFLADYEANGNMSSVWNSYKDSLTAATGTAKTGSRTSSASVETVADVGDTVYGAIIYFYHDDALNKDFYIANIASGTVGAESGLTISNLGTYYLGTSVGGTPTGGWQAFPEPTGAMLLVLGVAALALRRRQR